MEINIARDFDPYPWGRPQGRDFREAILIPNLKSISGIPGGRLVISLDGCRMLGSSFLDEAFAGLIRKRIIDHREFDRKLQIISESPAMKIYLDAIKKYVREARPET